MTRQEISDQLNIKLDAFESRLMIKIKDKLAETQPKSVMTTKSVKIVSPPPKTTVMLNLQLNA